MMLPEGTQLRRQLQNILCEARDLLARSGNDFTDSGWSSQDAALRNLDCLLNIIRSDTLPAYPDHEKLFCVGGHIEEVARLSGWLSSYWEVAGRYEAIRRILFARHLGPLALPARGLLLDPFPCRSLRTGFEAEHHINCL
jgi:hypothetical protein